VGPTAEADALYVRQLRLADRVAQTAGPFVIWDIGLGAAANPLIFLRSVSALTADIRILSFDHTLEPLSFALQHVAELPYLTGFEEPLSALVAKGHSSFRQGNLSIDWQVHVSDFPSLISSAAACSWEKPHAIMFDAFSPAKNPAMWTAPLFTRIFSLLESRRPCALPTYSRSTLLRVTLLLAGFFVGVGHATGEKEETTIAANDLTLIEAPLDHRWLERAHRSTSAEPLWEPVYRQAPLSPGTWEKLRNHAQFK
jgi:tRNA U34 5-methylaminomethyl-2-thiouridine-forming methyltransferase MnmC